MRAGACRVIAFRLHGWKTLEELWNQLWLPQKLESLRAGACRIIAFRLQGWKMLEELRSQLWLPRGLEPAES